MAENKNTNKNKNTTPLKLTINNEAVSVEAEGRLSIEQLLAIQNVESPDMVSVQHNGNILNRDEFAYVFVADGDEINFLYFMGGGK